MLENIAARLRVTPEALKEELRTFFVTTVGTLLYCVGTVFFIKPAMLPNTGVMGVCLFLNYLSDIPLGLSNAVFNFALFLFAYKMLPKRFFYWTLYSTVLMSLGMEFFARFPAPVIADRMLLVVVAAVLHGIALATVFSGGGSTGGIDIVCVAGRRKTGVELGNISMLLNFAVILLFFWVVSVENVVYGLLLSYITSLVMNGDLRAFSSRKEAMIITSEAELVRNYIVYTLHRGVTIFDARGGFNAAPRHVLITLLAPRQEILLKLFLKEHDPNAFLRLSVASEVLGKGFQKWEE